METVRRAVIDVGTNSVKLLLAEVTGREVVPVLEEGWQTRLGQGFYESRLLSAEAIQRTAQAVGMFAAKARAQGVQTLRVLATSAAREARNPEALISAGVPLEIISGDQEAELGFRGVTSAPRLASASLLVLDVGGGSTEFIVGKGAQTHFRRSFSLGSVRLFERFPPADPPTAAQLAACRAWLRQFLESEVAPLLKPILRDAPDTGGETTWLLVGAGGTATVLGCMEANLPTFDRARLESLRLSAAQVRFQAERLWGLPLAARQRIVGLPPNRADIILTGVLIYEAIMEQFGFNELSVSTRGLRFAAVMQAN